MSQAGLSAIDPEELREIQRYLTEVGDRQIASLSTYWLANDPGFFRADALDGISISSTATCSLSLTRARRWKYGPWATRELSLAQRLLKQPWKGSGLPDDNPFTVAYALEAAWQLGNLIGDGFEKDPECAVGVSSAVQILQTTIATGKVAISEEHSSSAYATHLVARVLHPRHKLDKGVPAKIVEWATKQIGTEIVLLVGNSKNADPFGLVYALMLVAMLSEDSENPSLKNMLRVGLQQFFAAQLPDGSWPRSRPLFHHPKHGSVYCFDYEMLAQLMLVEGLRDDLLRYLPKLALAFRNLRETAIPRPNSLIGWSSGQLTHETHPESWSTADAFHFSHQLGRLVAEQARRNFFAELGTAYTPPGCSQADPDKFAAKFLDCPLQPAEGKVHSLREILLKHLVAPVVAQSENLIEGIALPKQTHVSAILFGPPGTSKTDLAEKVALHLNWPLVTIDPSHLVRGGMDRIQMEANTLFGMMSDSERVVVLLDEFDELVQDRSQPQVEAMSRFLTTAMLPKLTLVNKRRRIVLLLATNFIDRFDFAINRPGRFDLILQVMPPTAAAKLQNWPEIRTRLKIPVNDPKGEDVDRLARLTYAETDSFVSQLSHITDDRAAAELLRRADERCTLNQDVYSRAPGNPKKRWLEVCEEQRRYIRFPELVTP
jgi:hypothetical protein